MRRSYSSRFNSTLQFVLLFSVIGLSVFALDPMQDAFAASDISVATFDDPDNGDSIFSNGDTLIIDFGEATNSTVGGNMNNAEIQANFTSTDTNIFTDGTIVMNGFWDTAQQLTITFDAIGGGDPVVGDTIAYDPTNGSIGDSVNTEMTGGTVVTGGDFGAVPTSLLTVVADDPDNSESTLASGDIIIVTFDQATNATVGGSMTNTELNGNFTFASGSFTTDSTGLWDSATQLTITIGSGGGGMAIGDAITVPTGANIGDGVSGDVVFDNNESITLSGDFGAGDGGSGRGPDATPPTLGQTQNGAQIVTGGFSFNGMAIDAQRYHTEFPLIQAEVGQMNTIGTKIYENSGPSAIRFVEFALGSPAVGSWHGAEAYIEVWLEQGSIDVKEIKINDKLNLIEDDSISVVTDEIECSDSETSNNLCLALNLDYMYREAPLFNVVGVKPVDMRGYGFQYYFNDGIEVIGESMNPALETEISAGKGTYHPQKRGYLQLTQIDRGEKLWEDQYGIQWKIDGNVVKQLTQPDFERPVDNSIGEPLGMDRMHPLFEEYKYEQHLIAMKTLEKVLGTTDVNKPMPKSLGTILFGPQENEIRRSTVQFQILIYAEVEKAFEMKDFSYNSNELPRNNFEECNVHLKSVCVEE